MTQTVGFDFVDRRVMAAVQRVAANDPNPADPFRGLYISDETALQLTRGESASGADDRLAAVTAALGLDLLDAAVLATCAAPELNPRFGRLFAYLQDDVTRKLPSARLVGHLLEGEGVTAADVMTCFDLDRPLRRLGAVKLLGDAQTPLAERPLKVADRLAAHLLGARLDELPAPSRLRLVPTSRPTTRAATSTSPPSPRCSPARASCRSSCAGRTPRRCSPRPTRARSSSRTCATWSSAT